MHNNYVVNTYSKTSRISASLTSVNILANSICINTSKNAVLHKGPGILATEVTEVREMMSTIPVWKKGECHNYGHDIMGVDTLLTSVTNDITAISINFPEKLCMCHQEIRVLQQSRVQNVPIH